MHQRSPVLPAGYALLAVLMPSIGAPALVAGLILHALRELLFAFYRRGGM